MSEKAKTVSFQGELTTLTCPGCGVGYAIPDKLEVYLRRTHQTTYCPHGHSLNFPQENDHDRLMKEIESLRITLVVREKRIALLDARCQRLQAGQVWRRLRVWWCR